EGERIRKERVQLVPQAFSSPKMEAEAIHQAMHRTCRRTIISDYRKEPSHRADDEWIDRWMKRQPSQYLRRQLCLQKHFRQAKPKQKHSLSTQSLCLVEYPLPV